MARGSNSHIPFVLAFSEIERGFSRAANAPFDGYPPFNVERFSGDGPGTARLRITLAVAGFSVDQIEIVHGREQLVIRGRQQDERERFHLHRGIATRQFQRVFILAEAMQVALATLDRGLLSVELAPREAE
ncbi:Heat shock protein HSP20 [Methylocella tundrae]|uniref:Heat shock protein HSP20 n=1 Tax=Methylocella tundrae TaxID=227605 RepID=A0A4U8Z5P4_METTU|nr:Hsp20 family protein [Methylocella tundrae]WPP04469.1 Hsp20 family protein [Methylocella tundrae]VFU10854.1 Heat shock protein HSP20 [Methylocella tundrae]VTZ25452.1 Heat shock protein HSP20 [Methylocella tundrae]VTZ50377.1 Heat shock protein HSP20 [Methylocella tundrae]